MTRQLRIADEARADLSEAVEWLAQRSPELPSRFEFEVERVFQAIAENPDRFPTIQRSTRRALLRHFPYSVFFAVFTDEILVLGVIHQARHPRT